jgi:putative MFS transporter
LKVGKFHRRVRLQAGLGASFDSLDLGTLAFVLPAVVAVWHLSPGQTGFLSSSALIGSLIGGLCAGVTGDAFGRRRVMMYAITLFCLGSLIGAVAPTWEVLFASRVITGIGCGAESAILAVYVTELVAARYRGRYVASLVVFFAIGYVIAASLGTCLVPLDNGWRWLQLVGGLPVFVLLLWRRTLPETPRWLLLKGRTAEADRVVRQFEAQSERRTDSPSSSHDRRATEVAETIAESSGLTALKALFSTKLLRITVTSVVVWFIAYFCYYGFITWIPSLLMGRGFTLTKSFGFTILIYAAQIPGQYLVSRLLYRFDHKSVFMVYVAGGVMSALLLAQVDVRALIITLSAFTSFFMSGLVCCLFSYTPALFPTAIRSFGYGFCYAFGRVGSVVSPILIGVTFPSVGFGGVFGMFTVLLAVGATIMLIFSISARGKTLEEIESMTTHPEHANPGKEPTWAARQAPEERKGTSVD